MSDDLVMEVTQLIRDKQGIQNDMSEALLLVKGMFEERYINKFNHVIQNHQLKTQKNPPKEVKLLHALKPFIKEDNVKNLDKIIDAMLMVNTMQTVQSEFAESFHKQGMLTAQSEAHSANQIQGQSEILHDDGVYEIDNNCMIQKQSIGQKNATPSIVGILLILAMISR